VQEPEEVEDKHPLLRLQTAAPVALLLLEAPEQPEEQHQRAQVQTLAGKDCQTQTLTFSQA